MSLSLSHHTAINSFKYHRERSDDAFQKKEEESLHRPESSSIDRLWHHTNREQERQTSHLRRNIDVLLQRREEQP
jgi:hypothetical protein